jgi:hypothetical protein
MIGLSGCGPIFLRVYRVGNTDEKIAPEVRDAEDRQSGKMVYTSTPDPESGDDRSAMGTIKEVKINNLGYAKSEAKNVQNKKR